MPTLHFKKGHKVEVSYLILILMSNAYSEVFENICSAITGPMTYHTTQAPRISERILTSAVL